eukprot:GGOE01000730.1.p1 GENE.GGOE01000730.1~~GGOE01000730.1.p1  ORF type:complete len:290 (-),score=48.00 GGOE01000730.1:450-1268(-)
MAEVVEEIGVVQQETPAESRYHYPPQAHYLDAKALSLREMLGLPNDYWGSPASFEVGWKPFARSWRPPQTQAPLEVLKPLDTSPLLAYRPVPHPTLAAVYLSQPAPESSAASPSDPAAAAAAAAATTTTATSAASTSTSPVPAAAVPFDGIPPPSDAETQPPAAESAPWPAIPAGEVVFGQVSVPWPGPLPQGNSLPFPAAPTAAPYFVGAPLPPSFSVPTLLLPYFQPAHPAWQPAPAPAMHPFAPAYPAFSAAPSFAAPALLAPGSFYRF